jgi:hypothetical protein
MEELEEDIYERKDMTVDHSDPIRKYQKEQYERE